MAKNKACTMLDFFQVRCQSGETVADDNVSVPGVQSSTESNEKMDCASTETEVSVSGEQKEKTQEGSKPTGKKWSDVRDFRDSWKHARPWLKLDRKKRLRFCTICVEADVANAFTRGKGGPFKLDDIKKHEKRQGKHGHSEGKKILEERRAMEKSKQRIKKKQEHCIEKVLRNCYWLAKHHLASSLLSDLNELCLLQGVGDLSNLVTKKADDTGSGSKFEYVSWDSQQEFLSALSEVLTGEIRSQIKESEFYSVMLDESTDVHVDQNILIFIKICHHGEPKTLLLTLKKLEGAKAEHIFNCFIAIMEEEGLACENLVGCATDGAAVMIGVKSGFVTRLKAEVPHLVAVHCIAHRLALASGQAADAIQYLVKYQDIVNNIAGYFQNSPLKMGILDRAFANFVEGETGLRCKKTFHTRWLSFEASVRAMLSNYCVLLSVFQEDKSARSHGFLHQLGCYKFLGVTSFLLDVLEELGRLCKTMQTSNLSFMSVGSLVEHTASIIESFWTAPGSNYKVFLEAVPHEVAFNETTERGEFQYHGHILRDSKKQRQEVHQIIDNFVDHLVENPNTRFGEKKDDEVFEQLRVVFGKNNFPESKQEACTYGVKELMALVDRFKAVMAIPLDNVEVEFRHFKFMMITRYRDVDYEPVRVCQAILKNEEHRNQYPVLTKLAKIAMVLPCHSVDVERGFSKQNLIKTRLRAQMKPSTLQMLMQISIEGPSVNEFPFAEAFKIWSAKTRRIFYRE